MTILSGAFARISKLSIALLLGSAWIASAQNPQLETKNGRQFATVVFSQALWNASPPYYSIAIDSTGNATYQSTPQSMEKTGVPYTTEFLASAAVRDSVFRLVQELNFLKLSSKDMQDLPAVESIDTLVFREGQTVNEITYHSSHNLRIQRLTSLFQSIAATLDFGRQLALMHQHGNAGVAAKLREMQEMAEQGRLREVQVVSPILNEIASDSTLDRVSRQRATSILSDAQHLSAESASQ